MLNRAYFKAHLSRVPLKVWVKLQITNLRIAKSELGECALKWQQ
nr:MAG TPA: hypothetical protein [Caudoviricetes sp.]